MPEEEDKLICADAIARSYRKWIRIAVCWCGPVVALRLFGVIGDELLALLAFPVLIGTTVAHYFETSVVCPNCGGKMTQRLRAPRIVFQCLKCHKELKTDVIYIGCKVRKDPG
jgi:hypothetical protein